MAFLLPAGLQAKQLVNYCLMNHAETEMPAGHHCDGAESDEEESATHSDNNHKHHECDSGVICACNIGHNTMGGEKWIPVTQTGGIYLFGTENFPPLITFVEPIRDDLQTRIGQHLPPLWLLYDTLLM